MFYQALLGMLFLLKCMSIRKEDMVGVLSRGLLSLISMNSKLLFCGGLQNRTTKFYNMIRTLLLAVWLMFMLAPASLAVEKEKIKVACIGNSITFGAGLSNQARDSYPAVLGQMLGSGMT